MKNLSVKDLERLLDEKKKESKGKRLTNLKVMDYIVIICIVSVIGFVVISLYQYYANGIPVSELKTEFFAFFGAELLAMAGIAISNNVGKKGGGKDED